jgi:prevent-host-death family protein
VKELPISVTAAARKFADCINRVHYQGVSFVLHKNGVPVARIVPVQSTSGADLEQLASALRAARTNVHPDAEASAATPLHMEEPRAISRPLTDRPARPRLNW